MDPDALLAAQPAGFAAALREHRGRPFAKWLHYFEIYDRHLARYRGRPLHFLEIGVDRGGSLELWRRYLGAAAVIHGVDVDPAARELERDGFRIHIGDQADAAFLARLKAEVPRLDVVIDDGGHHMHQIAASFEALYPHLAADGVYLCEDLHACYMQRYGGGYRRPESFLERSKDLIDRLHAAYAEGGGPRPDGFTQSTGSLHYYDSVLVVEKRPRRAGTMLAFEDGRLQAHPAVPR